MALSSPIPLARALEQRMLFKRGRRVNIAQQLAMGTEVDAPTVMECVIAIVQIGVQGADFEVMPSRKVCPGRKEVLRLSWDKDWPRMEGSLIAHVQRDDKEAQRRKEWHHANPSWANGRRGHRGRPLFQTSWIRISSSQLK